MLCRKLYTSPLPKIPHFHKFAKAYKISFKSAAFSIGRGIVPPFDQSPEWIFWWQPSYCDGILVTLWKSNALVHISSKKNPSWWFSDGQVTTEEGDVRRALQILLWQKDWTKQGTEINNLVRPKIGGKADLLQSRSVQEHSSNEN